MSDGKDYIKEAMEYNGELERKKDSNIISICNGEYGLDIISGDQIKPKQQPWFWNGIIPDHTSTLFAGYGGIGKTQLLLYIAAGTTRGLSFQAGGLTHQLPEGNVIILSGEDDPEYQLIPKLTALGADTKKIFILKMMNAPGKPKKFLDLNAHLGLLQNAIKKIGNVKLIIIDPIQYFIGLIKDYINSEVATLIGTLNDLAKDNELAIIMNKHLRKKGGNDSVSTAVDSVSGSGAWVNSPRQSWLIHPHPEQEDKVLFINLKVNIAKKNKKALAYKIDKATIPYNDTIIETTIMTWFLELEDMSADEALNAEVISPVQYGIKQWIIDYLLATPTATFSSEELSKEALEVQKFKKSTFFKVRKKLIDEGIVKENLEGKYKKTLMVSLIESNSYKK